MGNIVSRYREIIIDVGFQTFFEALLNQETHEYKDL